MSGREVGYYGPSDYDVGIGCMTVLIAVLGIPLMLALLTLSLQGEPAESTVSEAASEFEGAVNDVPINAGDERAMHAVGLPTKRDVLEWHETGRWGYGRFEDGEWVVRTFDSCPTARPSGTGYTGWTTRIPRFVFDERGTKWRSS